MELKDYCNNVDKELSNWHNKLSSVVGKMDSMPSSVKQGMYEEINGLHIVMTEMDDRIDRLRNECSVSWEPESDEATPTVSGSSKRFKEESDIHFDYDFGG